jgi:hypothetical protein
MTAEPSAKEDDVQALIRAVHQDRAAAKEKERRESWTKYVSLMIVVLAVATGIGSLKAGGFGSRVLLNQSRASDAWAFYQSKSIKRHLAEMEARAGSAEARAIATAEIARYRDEEAQVKQQAEEFEAQRDAAAKHGPPLGFAIASLQIAIALASVCLITKRKQLWAVSGVLGALGFGYLVFGLYLV